MPPIVLVAPTTFKGSLTAEQATRAMGRGVSQAWPGATVRELPMSDGGEGMVETLVAATGGKLLQADVTDALGRPIQAPFGVLGDGTVVINLSSAAGLVQLQEAERAPLRTSTFGVGQLIAAAYDSHPFRKLILALGGSATVDGGVGIMQALGVRFLDASEQELPRGGGALVSLARIECAGAHPLLAEAAIQLAVDVENPLLGERGAAPVYAPQKGASGEDVQALTASLTRLADVLEATTGIRVHERPGTGSAGGVPATLVALANAQMVPGFDLIATAVALEDHMEGVSLVITGEGQLDEQSFEGKLIGRLLERCQDRGLPLVAIAGNLTLEGEARLNLLGGMAMPLVPGPMAAETAFQEAETLLERATSRAIRLLGPCPLD